MVRTPVFKFLSRGAVALLVMAFTIGAAGAHPVHAAPSTLISDGWMPFTGSLYDSQTNSNIGVKGLVHIVARWQSVSASQVQLDISANLPAAGVLDLNASSVQLIKLPDLGEG